MNHYINFLASGKCSELYLFNVIFKYIFKNDSMDKLFPFAHSSVFKNKAS